MNNVLERILDRYWTNECEKELKKYLLKFGFFADDAFTRTKYGEIIGEEKVGELFNKVNQRARKIEISYCGKPRYPYDGTSLPSFHIPYLYMKSFKFKWGLKPEIVEKKCKYCNKKFIPTWDLSPIIASIEKNYPQIRSLNELDFCERHALGRNELQYRREPNVPCKVTLPKEKMIQFIRELTDLIGFIPSSSFKEDLTYLNYLNKNEFNKVLILLNNMPPYKKNYNSPYGYKEVFGSWFKALIAAGVLEKDSQQLSFGSRVLANDGHECLSLGEKTIDDWLYLKKIPHDREPLYPGEYLRADWKVGKFFIEYWGLKGKEDYDKKILIKREIAKEKKIPLIEICPEDLPNLEMKLKILKN